MNIQKIINKLDYLHNNVNVNPSYDFLPILITQLDNSNLYVPIINSPILSVTETEKVQEYDYCWFMSKSFIISFMFHDYPEFIKNVNLTGVFLWENHLDKSSYFTTWLYALCNQIIRNESEIPLYKNSIFKDYILELLNSIEEFSKENNIELPKYKRGALVLPKGLLFNQNSLLSNLDEKVIVQILSNEILYIKANYYICPIRDIRLHEASKMHREVMLELMNKDK